MYAQWWRLFTSTCMSRQAKKQQRESRARTCLQKAVKESSFLNCRRESTKLKERTCTQRAHKMHNKEEKEHSWSEKYCASIYLAHSPISQPAGTTRDIKKWANLTHTVLVRTNANTTATNLKWQDVREEQHVSRRHGMKKNLHTCAQRNLIPNDSPPYHWQVASTS